MGRSDSHWGGGGGGGRVSEKDKEDDRGMRDRGIGMGVWNIENNMNSR